MSDSNNANDHPPPDGGPDVGPMPGRRNSAVRMWIGGALFLAAAVVTFIAGDDDRWISIPAAIVAAVALVDFLSVNQRRRRTSPQ